MASKRERELARMRAQRQAELRTTRARQRRQRVIAIAASVVAVVLVVVGVTVGLVVSSGGGKINAAATPSATVAPGHCAWTTKGDQPTGGRVPGRPPTTAAKGTATATLKTSVGSIPITLDTVK